MSYTKLDIDQNGYLKFNNKIIKPKYSIKKQKYFIKKKLRILLNQNFIQKQL